MKIDEALSGLKDGGRLIVDRKDCPILSALLEKVDDGTLECELIEYDTQGSKLRFKQRIVRP